MAEPVLTGGCLCAGVRYEVRGQPAFMSHCHCSLCRRSTGAAYSTGVPVPREWFRFVAGEAQVRVYRHEDRKDMVFCSVCGSVLVSSDRWPEGAVVRLRAGTLDGDPGVRPMAHVWVDSKAAWDESADDLPRFADGVE